MLKFESLEMRKMLTVVHDLNLGVEGHEYVEADAVWGTDGDPNDSSIDGWESGQIQMSLPVEDGIYSAVVTVFPKWGEGETHLMKAATEGGYLETREIHRGLNEIEMTAEVTDGHLDILMEGIDMPPMANRVVVTWLAEAGWEEPCEDRLAGDATNDGKVDFADFLRMSANFGATDAAFEDGDFDFDGVVGFNDFLALSHNYGATCL